MTAGPQLPPLASCLACHSMVAVAQTERGRDIILDAYPSVDGPVAVPLDGGGVPVVRYLRGEKRIEEGREWRASVHKPSHWRAPRRPRWRQNAAAATSR